jgi:hypothetical protein
MRTFYLSTDTITEDMILASKDEFNAIGIEFEKIDDHYNFMHQLSEADLTEEEFEIFNIDPRHWEKDEGETYIKYYIDGIGRTWEWGGDNFLALHMMRIRFEQIFRTRFIIEYEEETLEENGIFFEKLDDGYEIRIKGHTYHIIQEDQKEAA